jgi:hypothetical protein
MSKVIKKMFMSSSSTSIGTMGEDAGYLDFHVGDIVSYISYENNIVTTFICKENGNGRLMGHYGPNLNAFKSLTKVIPYQYVTEQMLNSVRKSSSFYIKEEQIQQLTLDELKKYVPFPFELVNNK